MSAPIVPTRGERNNNPMLLNYIPSSPWRGQVGLELIPKGMSFKARFGRYDTVHNGIRAGAKELLTYQTRDAKKRSIYSLISTWAPGADHNDVAAYVADCCNHCGVAKDADYPLSNLDNLKPLVTAIIRHENGRVIYTDDLIEAACRDALGLPARGVKSQP